MRLVTKSIFFVVAARRGQQMILMCVESWTHNRKGTVDESFVFQWLKKLKQLLRVLTKCSRLEKFVKKLRWKAKYWIMRKLGYKRIFAF